MSCNSLAQNGLRLAVDIKYNKMKLYLSFGITYIAILLGVNLAIDFSWQTILNFLLVAVIVCLPALIVMILCRLAPKKVYNPNNKLFSVRKKENKFYEKIKIRRWKDKVPEAGKLGGFKKDKLESPKDPEYLRKFLVESCIAEAIHTLSICWGIVSLLLVPRSLLLCFGVPLCVFNLLIHIMPVMIQRYIRPKLLRALELLQRLQAKANQPADTDLEEANVK